MLPITLNAEQVSILIEKKYLTIFDNSVIELNTDSIILNCDGDIYSLASIDIQFYKREIDNKHVINYLKNLICEHLNFKPCEVIYSRDANDEFEFKIRFAPNIEIHMVVCEGRRAVNNVKAYSDDNIDININTPFIGLYKRLGDSSYYFRWFDEI